MMMMTMMTMMTMTTTTSTTKQLLNWFHYLIRVLFQIQILPRQPGTHNNHEFVLMAPLQCQGRQCKTDVKGITYNIIYARII